MSSHTHHHHHRAGRARGDKGGPKQAVPPAAEASGATAAGLVTPASEGRAAPAREPNAAVRAPGPSQPQAPPASAASGRTTGVGILLRVVWMGLGNLALAGLAVTIMQAGGRFGVRDGLYVALITLLAGVRWLDITRYEGTTADGRPATLRDLRRYVVVLVGVAAALLVVCHLAGRWLAGAA